MRRKKQRGQAIIEFALIATPLVTLLLGVTVVGFGLGRSVRVAQICRDANSMFVRGVDFAQPGNQDILVRLGQSLGLARTAGSGVVIFSKVTWIPQSTCDAIGTLPCNGNRHVITQRIVVGNTGVRASALGTPDSDLLDAKGLVQGYVTEPSAAATFTDLQLQAGEFAYVTETYFPSPDLDLPGFSAGSGNYSRAIF